MRPGPKLNLREKSIEGRNNNLEGNTALTVSPWGCGLLKGAYWVFSNHCIVHIHGRYSINVG